MKLSVVIPAYNERCTIGNVLISVVTALSGVAKEIIIVDDCSTDGTRDWLRTNLSAATEEYEGLTLRSDGNVVLTPATPNRPRSFSFKVLYHERNKGKGGSLQTGLSAVTGDIVVIQDADLEYDPQDWDRMYALIAERKVADVVYGSRFYGEPHRSLYFHHYMGNRLIAFLFNFLYNQTLTDIEVCYKMFTKEVLDSLAITCDDFGFEVQITAQIARARKWRIYEMGISYYGRTYAEGKKIKWKDGIKALWYLVKFRF